MNIIPLSKKKLKRVIDSLKIWDSEYDGVSYYEKDDRTKVLKLIKKLKNIYEKL